MRFYFAHIFRLFYIVRDILSVVALVLAIMFLARSLTEDATDLTFLIEGFGAEFLEGPKKELTGAEV